MKPIAIFYHCLFYLGEPPELLTNAVNIVHGQMFQITHTGLLDEARELHVGINGGTESLDIARLIIPPKARIELHGLDSRSENATIHMIEKWLPGHQGWYVLYFHSKGATKPNNPMSEKWRECMMRPVNNWRQSVRDLDNGYESVGCHWMTGPRMPLGQSIWAGNFWWATADFLLTLPSIMDRARVKMSGLKALESRFESEVWIGNGFRLPYVKDYHAGWNPSKISTCHA